MNYFKIGFFGFWQKSNPLTDSDFFEDYLIQCVEQITRKEILVVNPLEEEAQILFISYFCIYNRDAFKGNPLIILYSGESDYPKCYFDYSITHEPNTSRNLYYPFINLQFNTAELVNNKFYTNKHIREDGCIFINGNPNKYKEDWYNIVKDIIPTTMAGRATNFPVENKIEFVSKYKFNLCCENTYKEGYITEKLLEAFAAGAIPIYAGGGDKINDIFYEESFINASFMTKNELADKIYSIINNEDLYNHMISMDKFKDKNYINNQKKILYSFLEKIIRKEKLNAE